MEQKTWLAEEVYRHNTFGIDLLSKSQFKKLKEAKCTKIQGVYETFSYNLLSCPEYQARFNYPHARLRFY
jgi:hypothetical protein